MRPIDAHTLMAELLSLTYLYDSQYYRGMADERDRITRLIEKAPTIDIVKHGEWDGWKTQAFIGVDEFHDPKWADRVYYQCSLCGRGTAVKSDFCPKCGAYMREEQEK
jgi:hypothetical protein